MIVFEAVYVRHIVKQRRHMITANGNHYTDIFWDILKDLGCFFKARNIFRIFEFFLLIAAAFSVDTAVCSNTMLIDGRTERVFGKTQ